MNKNILEHSSAFVSFVVSDSVQVFYLFGFSFSQSGEVLDDAPGLNFPDERAQFRKARFRDAPEAAEILRQAFFLNQTAQHSYTTFFVP